LHVGRVIFFSKMETEEGAANASASPTGARPPEASVSTPITAEGRHKDGLHDDTSLDTAAEVAWEEWDYITWPERDAFAASAALGGTSTTTQKSKRDTESTALQSLEELPNITVDAACFSEAQRLLGQAQFFEDDSTRADAHKEFTRKHMISLLGVFLDIGELDAVSTHTKMFSK
jgi:hypothetical protein